MAEELDSRCSESLATNVSTSSLGQSMSARQMRHAMLVLMGGDYDVETFTPLDTPRMNFGRIPSIGGPVQLPETLYRFKCSCSGMRELHVLKPVGYTGFSFPAVWVDQGSYYQCRRCGTKRTYKRPPVPQLPPNIVELNDEELESL